MKTAKDIQLANLKSDLETLVNRYNEHPTRANAQRIRAIRLEIAEVANAS